LGQRLSGSTPPPRAPDIRTRLTLVEERLDEPPQTDLLVKWHVPLLPGISEQTAGLLGLQGLQAGTLALGIRIALSQLEDDRPDPRTHLALPGSRSSGRRVGPIRPAVQESRKLSQG
jgi:hypothetical protein